jgi:hypothetical protein
VSCTLPGVSDWLIQCMVLNVEAFPPGNVREGAREKNGCRLFVNISAAFDGEIEI